MLDRKRHYSDIFGPCLARFYQDGVYFDSGGRSVPEKFAGMRPEEAEKAGHKPGAHKATAPAQVEAKAKQPKAAKTITPEEYLEGRAQELASAYKINDLRSTAKAVAEAAGIEPPNLRGSKIELARWVAANSDE